MTIPSTAENSIINIGEGAFFFVLVASVKASTSTISSAGANTWLEKFFKIVTGSAF